MELVVQPASTRRSQRRRLLAQGIWGPGKPGFCGSYENTSGRDDVHTLRAGDLFVHHFDLPVLLDGCYLVMKFKDGRSHKLVSKLILCHVSN